jgi:hypothetical protein
MSLIALYVCDCGQHYAVDVDTLPNKEWVPCEICGDPAEYKRVLRLEERA